VQKPRSNSSWQLQSSSGICKSFPNLVHNLINGINIYDAFRPCYENNAVGAKKKAFLLANQTDGFEEERELHWSVLKSELEHNLEIMRLEKFSFFEIIANANRSDSKIFADGDGGVLKSQSNLWTRPRHPTIHSLTTQEVSLDHWEKHIPLGRY
jgi:hypothetical protein